MGLFGLEFGSFANVVIYRVPNGRSIVRPSSACQSCGAGIKPYDNVPVVSWLVLGGRCRACRAPISARYPLVEALTGLLFAGIALRFGPSWTAMAEAALALGLVALAFIDLDHMLLPRRVVYVTLAAVMVLCLAGASASGTWRRFGMATACAVVPWAIFYVVNFVASDALGFGDVRLAFLIGFGLGWLGPRYAVLGFLVASLLGSVVGLWLVATRRAGRKTSMPFGTFLAAGTMLAVLAGQPVLAWYGTALH